MNQAIYRIGLHIAMLMCLFLGMADRVYAAAPAEAGVVVNLEGSLAAKGADGSLHALAEKGKVFVGDALFTGKDSYARIKFLDGGMMSLRPHAHFNIENFNFDEKQPDKDKAVFGLVKGGMRAVSGLIGKRGDPDSYGVKTNTATIGIRGTNFGVQLCKGDCGDLSTPDGIPPADGLHIDVTGGAVLVKNAGGSQLLTAGQYGYVKEASSMPTVVPADHAIRVEIPARIMLDKVRGGPSNGAGGAAGSAAGAPGAVGGSTPNVCPTAH